MNNNMFLENNNKINDDFHVFMEKNRVVKTNNSNPTHTSMGKYKGSFVIPDNKIIEFYKLYKKYIKKNIPSILEVHLEQGPIIIDLDFHYYINNDEELRKYNDEDIKNILKIYNQVILTCLNVNENDMHTYILEKKNPKIGNKDDINNKTFIKDGIHIIYPYICTNAKVQLFFRDAVLEKIKSDKILEHLNLDNNLDQVFDISVIERNNWLLYGSCKEANPDYLYKLTKVYDINFELVEIDSDDILELPSTLSIQKYKFKTDCSYFAENINMDIIEIEHIKIIGKNKDNTKPFALNSELKKTKKLLSILSSDRAKNYLTWIDVGFCLHNIDYLLLDEWIEFSKKSLNNYKEGECEKLWENFKYEGLGIGSLYRWAKQDNIDSYTDFLLEEFDDLIKNSLTATHASLAKVFYEFNKFYYKCYAPKKDSWYEYIDHRWVFIEYPVSIINKLNNEFVNNYTRLQIAFLQKSLCIEDNNEKKKLLEKSQKSLEISIKLQDMKFKIQIIKELEYMFYDSTFIDKLDENRNLIGFNNGIYDLKNDYFRNGRPEDYISMSTNVDYNKYNINNPQFIEVNNFFESIQPEKDLRTYLLLSLSSLLDGFQREQKFEIWTGSGANGKGRITKLILDSFGDYATTISVTFLTKPKGSSSNASPDLANTKGKRVCIFQEPEDDDKIYVGNMKSITGGDKLQARKLYSNPIEFYPQFKTILACNKLPTIPSNDGGTWRRIRVVPFEMKFVENPREKNERKRLNNLDEIMNNWKVAFMSILIEQYKFYIKYGIVVPSEVCKYTDEYKNNSNTFKEFINDKIIISDDNMYIILEDILILYKRWYKDNYPNPPKKIQTKTDIKSELESILGKININNKFYGYQFKTEYNNDDLNQKHMDLFIK